MTLPVGRLETWATCDLERNVVVVSERERDLRQAEVLGSELWRVALVLVERQRLEHHASAHEPGPAVLVVAVLHRLADFGAPDPRHVPLLGPQRPLDFQVPRV